MHNLLISNKSHEMKHYYAKCMTDVPRADENSKRMNILLSDIVIRCDEVTQLQRSEKYPKEPYYLIFY